MCDDFFGNYLKPMKIEFLTQIENPIPTIKVYELLEVSYMAHISKTQKFKSLHRIDKSWTNLFLNH